MDAERKETEQECERVAWLFATFYRKLVRKVPPDVAKDITVTYAAAVFARGEA